MALKPVAEMRRQSPGFSLAVPFPGAMALKQAHQNRTEEQREPCSPLPRGDGAETEHAAQYIGVHAALAVPFPGAMALKHHFLTIVPLDPPCLQSPSPGRWR